MLLSGLDVIDKIGVSNQAFALTFHTKRVELAESHAKLAPLLSLIEFVCLSATLVVAALAVFVCLCLLGLVLLTVTSEHQGIAARMLAESRRFLIHPERLLCVVEAEAVGRV